MREPMTTFDGRTFVVTGAASGIGRALALHLASRGSDVAICDVNEDELAVTARDVERRGRKATAEVVDVADRGAMHAFAERVIEAHGRVHGVINNAGVSVTDRVATMSYEDLEWIVGINLWGVIHGTKAFLPHLIENGDGWVVNVSSVFGIIAVPGQSAYNLTKFAVRGYTESLRQELDGTGVTALCVHPGGIKTNIVRNSRHHDAEVDKETAVKGFDEQLARTTAEDAARIIVEAMERRAPRVLVGPDAYVIDVVQRIVPERYTKIFKLFNERGRAKLEK